MLKVNIEIESLEKLQKHIELVEKMMKLIDDIKFKEFLQKKCIETIQSVAKQRVHGSTNDEYLEEYLNRNQIRETSNGFEIYNNFTIPVILSTKNTKNQDRTKGIVRNYDEGFNIAMAFEYGVGIVGITTGNPNAWEYDINNYGENGWYYKTQNGDSIRTSGYVGFEVYRFSAIEINSQLPKWVNDYIKEVGIV